MKIENLLEKDTVLDDDYLIVDGTDGTKKVKKSNFLRELKSSINEKLEVYEYNSDGEVGDDDCKSAILASPHTHAARVIAVKRSGGANEYLFGGDIGDGYSYYLLISYYRGIRVFKEAVGVITVTDVFSGLS